MEAVHGEPGGGAQDTLIPIWLTSAVYFIANMQASVK
jgi:hypothetical protein